MDRTRHASLRTIAVLLALAALLAACSTSKGSTTGAAATEADNPSPGVTADTLNVGYLIVDIGSLSQRLGFKVINDGGVATTTKAIQAVVNAVNANGGVGGRKLNAIIKAYDANQDSPEYAEAQCRSFTQDTQVFAVVLDGQYQTNARPCYKAQRAIMLDQTLLAHDQTEFQSYSPYLWAPSEPTFDPFVAKQLEVLKQAGWFNGSTGVAIIAPDTDVTRRVTEQVVTPYLQSIGITNSSPYYIDSSNAGTLGATSSAALTSATNKGYNRVFVVGGARVLGVAISTQEAQDLVANYSISSFDSPAFLVDNPGTIVPERRIGMEGIGFEAASDMRANSSNEPFPDPARPNEVLCKQIIDAGGGAPPEPNRENYRVSMQFCDATLLLKAALDKAPKELTPNVFKNAVWSLGNSWTSALAYGSGWAPNQYAGATVVRGMVWNDACQLNDRTFKGCFIWGTGDIQLSPPAAVVGTPAPTTPAATQSGAGAGAPTPASTP